MPYRPRRLSTVPTCSAIAAFVAAIACASVPAPAEAQEVLSEREARSSVAAPGRVSVVVADLDFIDAATSRAVEQFARNLPYYAAIAVSPGEPATSGLPPAPVNYHSPQAAAAAALAVCDDHRTSGGPCVIVAQTVPRGYEAGQLTLSKQATEALRGDFRRLDNPKAFAISPGSGHFGMARGDGSRALSACNRRAAADGAAQDCRIVVAER